ncbi:MAG TPA: hypothetical protein VIY08_14785 [Candidatus Nitrosocosmicus sp.]
MGPEYIWVWVSIETIYDEILGINMSKERNMFVADYFLSYIIEKYGNRSVSTNDGTCYSQACRFRNSYMLFILLKRT